LLAVSGIKSPFVADFVAEVGGFSLMALCDRLEVSLTAATDIRRRLLEALLAEALAPDGERDEAAE